jgi:hypothetical protein
MCWIAVACLFWAASAMAQPGIDFGRYFALVLGSNDYRHLPTLKTAAGDARAIADLLRARYGFQVELLLDADRDTIIRAVNRYRAELRDGDNFLIYYAGHGLVDEATERGFWLPVDAERSNEARWIDVAVISSNLRAMQARHVIVIADSCYAGSLVRASHEAGLATGGERSILLSRMRERRARMALTSGSLEPVVDSGGSGHSVFANAMLAVLRENVDIMSGAELFARLRGRVVANARQTPLYSDIRFTGHEGGDFLFVPRGATLELSVAAAPSVTEAALELAFWNSIKDSVIPDDYQAYLDAFPRGRFAPLARRRVEVAIAPRPGGPVAPAPQTPPSVGSPVPKVATAPAPLPPAPVVRPPAALPTETHSASAPRPANGEDTAKRRPKGPAPPQIAPSPTPAEPAVTDASALAKRWPEIARALRQQFDRNWARSDNAFHLNTINRYRVDAISADEVSVTLDYMVQDAIVGGANGFSRPRINQVRFRNRAPAFAVLQWGAVPAETPLPDAAQFAIHWETIRDRIMAQYDRDIAIADGAFDMAEIGGFHVEHLGASEIVLVLDYTPNPIGAMPALRRATVHLENRSPSFRIRRWGDLPVAASTGDDAAPSARMAFAGESDVAQFWPILRRALERQYIDSIRFRPTEGIAGAAETGPPDDMSIKRYTLAALDSELITLAVTYEVAGAGAARRDRDASVMLRNAGPVFEIVQWQR